MCYATSGRALHNPCSSPAVLWVNTVRGIAVDKSKFLFYLPGYLEFMEVFSSCQPTLGQLIALRCIDYTDQILKASLSCPHRGMKWRLRCLDCLSCPYRANGKSLEPLGELHPPWTTTGGLVASPGLSSWHWPPRSLQLNFSSTFRCGSLGTESCPVSSWDREQANPSLISLR